MGKGRDRRKRHAAKRHRGRTAAEVAAAPPPSASPLRGKPLDADRTRAVDGFVTECVGGDNVHTRTAP